MKLRRWRVARLLDKRKGGYDSPRTTYWTKQGATAAAEQLESLEPLEIRGVTQMIQGRTVTSWCPIRHRTLRGIQAHNIVMESGSYDRHPAGSTAKRPQDFSDADKQGMLNAARGWAAEPMKKSVSEMSLAEWWLEGPGSELLRKFDRPAPMPSTTHISMWTEPRKGKVYANLCQMMNECGGPWTADGHCIHCGKMYDEGEERRGRMRIKNALWKLLPHRWTIVRESGTWFTVGPMFVLRWNAATIAEARNDLIANLGPAERRAIEARPWHPIKVRTLRRWANRR